MMIVQMLGGLYGQGTLRKVLQREFNLLQEVAWRKRMRVG